MSVITCRDLSFAFEDKKILEKVSFTVAPGEIVALLGPNGAGKTTMVELLCGMRSPQSGEITVLGQNPLKAGDEWVANLGLVLQNWIDHSKWQVNEFLQWVGATYGLPNQAAQEALTKVELTEHGRAKISTLSGGERRRLDFAAATVANPKLLILDEPSTGLDAVARRDMHDLIVESADKGTAVLMTTHDLAEAERIASRVMILAQTKIIVDDSPQKLRDRLETVSEVSWISEGIRHVHTTAEPEKFISTLNADEISKLRIVSPTLEDTYVSLVEKAKMKEA